jgi:hypothetical protein
VTPAFLNPRLRCLSRGNVIVLSSLAVALPMSHFPDIRPAPWLLVPLFLILVGLADTTRCMRKRWNFYHGGVLMCLYMDLLAFILVLFLFLFPAFA